MSKRVALVFARLQGTDGRSIVPLIVTATMLAIPGSVRRHLLDQAAEGGGGGGGGGRGGGSAVDVLQQRNASIHEYMIR